MCMYSGKLCVMHEDSKAWGEGWYASMLARVPIYHIGYYLLTVCVRGSYCTVSSGGN
jgi:hypothetical protein